MCTDTQIPTVLPLPEFLQPQPLQAMELVLPALFRRWRNRGLGLGCDMPHSWLGHGWDRSWNLRTPSRSSISHSVKLANSQGQQRPGTRHQIKLFFFLNNFLSILTTNLRSGYTY